MCLALIYLMNWIEGIISILKYLESKPNVIVEPGGHVLTIEKRESTHSIPTSRKDFKKFEKVPNNKLNLSLSFSVRNSGERDIGIRGIYVKWAYPKFNLFDSYLPEYIVRCTKDEDKLRNFILKSNKEIVFNFEGIVSDFCSLHLHKNKNKYAKRIKKKNPTFAKRVLTQNDSDLNMFTMPKVIVFQIIAVDMKNKRTSAYYPVRFC